MRGLAQRLTRLKWHYIYFLLAAFDLLTVSAGLYLNHQIIRTYTRSVEINRVWDERIAAYSHLGELAAAVNAPGNDVFDSRKVDEESRKMRAALENFNQKLTMHRKELQSGEPAVTAPLLGHLDAIGAAMKQMTDEAELIFTYFRDTRPELAGQRMATMDRKYAKVNTTLMRLREQVTDIQKQNFDRQAAAAASLQKYEYMIGALILFMVAGATLYGHRIARQIQSDAEERQHHLEALREAEARTRCILDTAADGIVTFDENGRIESFNQAAECLLGYAAGEAIGQDIRTVIEQLAERLQGHGVEDPRTSSPSPASRVESTAKRRDGTTFPVELSVSEVRIGQRTIFTAIVRDVADRRKAEEAVQIATAAQAANRAKSTFLAAMSHELRTPLNGVIGAVELILGTELGADQREYLQIARTSADALLQLISDILDFSRAESGKLLFEDVDFDLRHSLEDALTTLSVRAAEKGLALTCHVAPEIPEMLVGDPGRLRQVVLNLVGNAIKFTERGRVALRVQVQERATHEVNLHFAICDTGIGISPEHRAHIFAPFEQGDGSITRKYGGTGLGLAISAQLVDIMGGVIWVDSELGKGSTFHFTARLGVSTCSSPKMPKRLTQFKGLRVLIVDDDTPNRRALQQMLTQWGMVPASASNGQAAVCALENTAAGPAGPFHLLLVDCKVPDALALAEYVKEATLPTIMMVRSAAQPDGCASACPKTPPAQARCAICADQHQCRQLGIKQHLMKPIRQSGLLDAIVSTLGTDIYPNEPPVISPENVPDSPRLQILVAEDNVINQKIAVRALEKWGHGVAVANNGREALALLDQQHFDLVLMDLQMPELDGFETTRAIRERDQANGGRVPIIAVTAHAMQGDSERCLQAGMDSYVSKPLQLQELFDEIQAVTAMRRPAVTSKKTCRNICQDTARALVEVPRLDPVNTCSELAGLSSEVMDAFVSDTPKQLKRLRVAVQNQDAAALQHVAHYLKGSAMYIGAQTMSQLCKDIEVLASQNLPQAAEAVATLQGEATRVCAALECRRQLSYE